MALLFTNYSSIYIQLTRMFSVDFCVIDKHWLKYPTAGLEILSYYSAAIKTVRENTFETERCTFYYRLQRAIFVKWKIYENVIKNNSGYHRVLEL